MYSSALVLKLYVLHVSDIIMCFSNKILDLLSESQQETETQHEIITILTLELRERDEENENLKQILNGKHVSS